MENIHLHIIGSHSFYDLLNELNFNYNISFEKDLKSNDKDLLVRIVFIEKLKLREINKFFSENIPTIFFVNNKDFLKKNKLILLDFHVLLFIPVEVLSFKEILNILITKYNFFKKSKIIMSNYEIDSNQRIITKNKTKVKLTEKELK